MPFSESDIPDLTGKVVIVTGKVHSCSSKFNYLYLFFFFLFSRWKLRLGSANRQSSCFQKRTCISPDVACRSVEKFDHAIKKIEDACGHHVIKNISFLSLDLGSAAAAKTGADEFNT